ncbi:MAG: YbhN family protein [Chitinophagales bacterium]
MKLNFGAIVKFILSLGIGLGLVYYLQSNISSEQRLQIIHGLKNIEPWLVILSILLAGLACIIRAYRWKMLLEPLGYQPRNSTLISSIFIMYLGNLIFPRLGEVLRCSVLMREEKIPMDKGIGTMITERLIDILGLGLYVILAIIFEYDKFFDIYKQYSSMKGETSLVIPGVLFCILVIGGLIVWRMIALRQFILEKIYGVLEGLKSILMLKNPFLFVAYSLTIYSIYYLSTYILFYAFSETMDLSLGCGLVVLIAGTLGVGLTQGGIGAYQVLVTWTLSLYGVSNTIAQTYSWAAWILTTATLVAFGVIAWAYLLKRGHGKVS